MEPAAYSFPYHILCLSLCLILIVFYVVYKLYRYFKLYNCCKGKVPCAKALADDV